MTFNKTLFIRTMVSFLAMTTLWTVLCIVTNEFTNRDKGFLTGLGFLVILSASICIGQKIRNLLSFISLTLFMIILFLISSFVLGPLIGLTVNSMIVYAIANSLFVSFATTMVLNKIAAIAFKGMTMILTFFLLLIAYFTFDGINHKLYIDYDFHPRLTMFNVFQLFLVIPLALGMNLKKADTQHSITTNGG